MPEQFANEASRRNRFTIGDSQFMLNGHPFQIISGSLQYFRVHPGQWADRIAKARLMGLNTIETYVAWNEHSPIEDVFDVTGRLDLARFLKLIYDAGLHAIVRPGPFICAEWDNGGLPTWLSSGGGGDLRAAKPRYLNAVQRYFDHVLPIVANAQISRGGPVIMVQVENEYGAHGTDSEYLRSLVRMMKAGEISVPLFTCDQANPAMLRAGGLPELLKTATFGTRSAERLQLLRDAQPTGPLMCAEFWNGWFDHWGSHHHTTNVAGAAAELDTLLAAGASVNIYMFHGGTNFGFTNGANDKGTYQPTVTSYDYDAPLAEDGYPTAKYHAYRKVIGRYSPVPDEPLPERPPAPTRTITLDRRVNLTHVAHRLGRAVFTEQPLTMDELGHDRGFVQYSTVITAPTFSTLVVTDTRDRAIVSVNGQPVGTLSRDHHEHVLGLPAATDAELTLLVENQGRVNYGAKVGEAKGLIGPIHLNGTVLTGWTSRPITIEPELLRNHLTSTAHPASAGAFFAASEFTLDEPADLYLDTAGWTKGVAYINGFNLGRYWSRGPQRTLYIPRPVTRTGHNELLLFELHGTSTGTMHLVSTPDQGFEDT